VGAFRSFRKTRFLLVIAGFDVAHDFAVAHTSRTVDPRALRVELDKLLPRGAQHRLRRQ
jgi:hypothetical protein